MSDTFDPSTHLRTLTRWGKDARGQRIEIKSEYLDVRWRVAWLRAEHPEASILTELMEHDRQAGYALFRATVAIPDGGGSATGWGSETRQDFGDYLEKAETKALGRALAHLRYGTQFAAELDEGGSVADAPVEVKPETKRATAPAVKPADADPDLPAAQLALRQAMARQNMTPAQVVDLIAPAYPHVARVPDLGTLTAPQLRLVVGLVEDTHHVAGGRIVAGPTPPADDGQ